MHPNPSRVTMTGCCLSQLSYYLLCVMQLQHLSLDYIMIKLCLCAVQLEKTLVQTYQTKRQCTILQKQHVTAVALTISLSLSLLVSLTWMYPLRERL